MSVRSMQKLWRNDFHNYVWYSLHANGWKYTLTDTEKDEEDTYMIPILGTYETTVTAHISSDISGFKKYGCLGVIDIEGEYEYEAPYGYNDLEDILYALEQAEDNLLTLEIPFDEHYEFHGKNKANKKRRNKAIRLRLGMGSKEQAIHEECKKEREQENEKRAKRN